MDNWWPPDPPGTINPAKLCQGARVSDAGTPVHTDTLTGSEAACQSIPSIASAPTLPRSPVPRLPRISSDWDPEHDIVLRRDLSHPDIRKEFEDLHTAKRRPARARHTSHRGHFRRQTEDGAKIHVPVDCAAGSDATVVVDRPTASIYDAYLLRVDITKNLNIFRRHQVRYHMAHILADISY